MQRPRPLPSATPTRVRYVALLLFIVQAMVAASPLFERRDNDGPPRVHVEQQDARHPNQHNESRCALCSARATSMLASVPLCPLGPSARRTITHDAAGFAVVSADAGLDHHSRAPPSHLA